MKETNKYAIGWLEPDYYKRIAIVEALTESAKNIGLKLDCYDDGVGVIPVVDDGVVNSYISPITNNEQKELTTISVCFILSVYNPIVEQIVKFSVYSHMELYTDDTISKVKTFKDNFVNEWKKKHKEFHNYASGTTIGDEEYNKLIVEKETLDLYEVICPNKEVK